MKYMLAWQFQYPFWFQICETNGTTFLFATVRLVHKIFRLQIFNHEFIPYFRINVSAFKNNDGDSWDEEKHDKIEHNLVVKRDFIDLEFQYGPRVWWNASIVFEWGSEKSAASCNYKYLASYEG